MVFNNAHKTTAWTIVKVLVYYYLVSSAQDLLYAHIAFPDIMGTGQSSNIYCFSFENGFILRVRHGLLKNVHLNVLKNDECNL